MGARAVHPDSKAKYSVDIDYRPQGEIDPETGKLKIDPKSGKPIIREDYKSLIQLPPKSSYKNPGSFGAYYYTHRR
jgi:hypothetical protein